MDGELVNVAVALTCAEADAVLNADVLVRPTLVDWPDTEREAWEHLVYSAKERQALHEIEVRAVARERKR